MSGFFRNCICMWNCICWSIWNVFVSGTCAASKRLINCDQIQVKWKHIVQQFIFGTARKQTWEEENMYKLTIVSTKYDIAYDIAFLKAAIKDEHGIGYLYELIFF